MSRIRVLFAAVAFSVAGLFAETPVTLNTQWIPSKPEVLTYRSTGAQGNGLYQVSISKSDSTIDTYMNIITPGFTKTVSATLSIDLRPVRSTAKIIVNGQITMDTRCSYEKDRLTISTLMMPYNRTMTGTPSFTGMVLDYSEMPYLVRSLELKEGASYSFASLNPQTNSLIQATACVSGQASVAGTDCFKVEVSDFEGNSVYWVEKAAGRRVMKIEQPETRRVTELIQ